MSKRLSLGDQTTQGWEGPYKVRKRSSLADEIPEEWDHQHNSGWARLALFSMFGLLPVICCGILLTILLLSSQISHDDTNAPMEEKIGPLLVTEVSSRILRPTLVQSRQTQHPRPKPSAMSPQPTTTAAAPPRDDHVKDPVCSAIDCHFVAQWLRSKLDSSVDPCQDFYRYVCGTSSLYNEFANVRNEKVQCLSVKAFT
ncbi:uncharacterized protein LOC142574165 [Dermacentor variabilis]|uniref:uncharacterized protein LOC142574165 n=1 Tax=Dermacentor variabilis TaxID=34621 RepID=UPI003F5C3F4A